MGLTTYQDLSTGESRISSINSIFDHLNEMRFFAELQISRSCNSRGLGFFRHLFVASRAHAKRIPFDPQKGSEQRKQHTTAKWFSSLVDPKTSSHFGTMTNKM